LIKRKKRFVIVNKIYYLNIKKLLNMQSY